MRKCRMGIVLSALGVGGVVLLSFSTIAGRATSDSLSLSLSVFRMYVCLDGCPSVCLYVCTPLLCFSSKRSRGCDAIDWVEEKEAMKEELQADSEAASCPLTHSLSHSLCVCEARCTPVFPRTAGVNFLFSHR